MAEITAQPFTLKRSVARIIAIPLLFVVALAAFVLSFRALTDIGTASGMDAHTAWMFPMSIDGIILVSTFAIFALSEYRLRIRIVPQIALYLFSAFSIYGNAMHAVNAGTRTVELPVAVVISALPAVALLFGTHLLVTMTEEKGRADRQPRAAGEPKALGAEGVSERMVVSYIKRKVTKGQEVTKTDMAKWLKVSEPVGAKKLKAFRERYPEAFAQPEQPALHLVEQRAS